MNEDKTEVNSILWKLQNRGLARQDNAYRWFVAEKSAGPRKQVPGLAKPPTLLRRLCRYYLECLSLDDEAGVGELLRRDQLRNMRLIELGWDVQGFWVYQLRDDMPECIQRVRNWHGTR